MKDERRTFFRRAQMQKEDVRNYKLDELESYILHNRPEHLRYYDNRKVNYLKNFLIPEEEYKGKNRHMTRSNFRKTVEDLLVEFSEHKSKEAHTNSQPANTNSEEQVSSNAYHVIVCT